LPQHIASSAQIVEAENGLQGFELYQSFAPQIVFMDLTMPIMDGYDSLASIKKFDENAFVVVVSADSQPKAIEKALSLGAYAHIEKNISETRVAEIFDEYQKRA
jgi:two-component system chemotaxis response regulator CheY